MFEERGKPPVRVSDALHGCLVLTFDRAALIRTNLLHSLLTLGISLVTETRTGCQGRLDGLMNVTYSGCQALLGDSRSLRERERLRTDLEFAYVGLEDSWHRADVGISR